MASIIEIESSAGLEDKSSNSSIHTEMEPEPEPDSVTDNNSTEIQESMDTGSLAEVASDVLNPVGIDYINIENISKFNENGFEKKPPDIGHCQLSWKEPDLNSKFITFCPDNLPPDSRCSSGHEKCHALFGLTRAQRTVIELAEAGLLHAFDCDVAFYREGAVESDEGGNVYSEEGSDVRTSPREAPYVTRDWSMLTARLEKNRVDDDICLTIRYVVSAHRDVSNLIILLHSVSTLLNLKLCSALLCHVLSYLSSLPAARARIAI